MVASLGIILGAIYMLHMVAKVIFGPLKTPLDVEAHAHTEVGHGPTAHAIPGDITAREVGILLPLAFCVILLGVVPNIILTTVRLPVDNLLSQTNAVSATQVVPTAAPAVQASLSN